MKSVREDDIEFAFSVMMNKLIFAEDTFCDPTLMSSKRIPPMRS
jgi:hypothetical protein